MKILLIAKRVEEFCVNPNCWLIVSRLYVSKYLVRRLCILFSSIYRIVTTVRLVNSWKLVLDLLFCILAQFAKFLNCSETFLIAYINNWTYRPNGSNNWIGIFDKFGVYIIFLDAFLLDKESIIFTISNIQ